MGKSNSIRRAGVSVFLSLTLVVILALLGTMVEVSRGKVCQVHGRRTLRSAADSLLTEYSLPFFQEYHLFFLEDVGKPFEKSIAEYAADTLEPEGIFPVRTDLFDLALTDLSVEGKTYAGDQDCRVLKEQITSYMKRSIAADAFRKFKEGVSSAESLGSSAAGLEQKAEEEKQAAELDTKVLALMELIDGVSVSEGRVQGKNYFVKMFCTGEKRAENLGITEASVWEAVREHVVEVSPEMKAIVGSGKDRDGIVKKISEVQEKTSEAIGLLKELGKKTGTLGISPNALNILTSNQRVLEDVKTLLQKPVAELDIASLGRLWKAYDTSGIVFDYTGINEEGGGENPFENFRQMISGGLTKLVVKDTSKLSKKKAGCPDQYRRLYDSQEESSDYTKAVQNFANEEDVDFQEAVKDISRIALSDFMLLKYMEKYFSTAIHSVGDMKKRLDYEWEYLVCGRGSDKENLEQVINRMVLMRTVINTGILSASASKRETAYAAALAVVGFTGLEPLVRFTQTLFIILWGMSEALVDTAGIIQGKRIPLIKTEKDLIVKFTDIFVMGKEYIMNRVKKLPRAGTNGFNYEHYLMLFLLGNGSRVTCQRMMDLMEWNIRDNYVKGFSLGKCVASFQVRGSFSMKTKFFRLPFIQKVLNRKLERSGAGTGITAGYLPENALSGSK